MTDEAGDRDLRAVTDPAADPRLLSTIAGRRWDLHPLIAAHPRVFPELRRWIAEVHPAGAPAARHSSPAAAPPRARPRRRGLGWWLGGCGCLAFVLVFFLAVFVGGALISSDRPSGDGEAPEEPPGDSAAQSLAVFDAERERYSELATELDGNPVASLVTEARRFRLLEQRAEAARARGSEAAAATEAEALAHEARELRETLEQRLAAAETRRANGSGSLAESIVDSAGGGFIDIRWDAPTACAVSGREGRTTAGCVSEELIAVHLLPRDEALGGAWAEQMTVVHELAHLYERADADTRGHHEMSLSLQLVEQGLFEGSSEKMADCYALTYFDEWTLETDEVALGYGYVCTEAERQAIREWAANINAPLP